MAWKSADRLDSSADSPAPLIAHGGTALRRADIDYFEVKIEGGGTLLTIPA